MGVVMEIKGWHLVEGTDGAAVDIGDMVQSFRGGFAVLKGGTPPHKPSSTGRVVTCDGEYFPSVYGLKWVKKESA